MNAIGADRLKSGYFGLRHIAPWVVRYLRALIGAGSTLKELQRLRKEIVVPKGVRREVVQDTFDRAVEFMISNPAYGNCINFQGDQQWDWDDPA